MEALLAYFLYGGNSADKISHYFSPDCSKIPQIFRKLKVNRPAAYCIAQVFESYINLHKNSFGQTSHNLSDNCTFIAGVMGAVLHS